MLNHYIYPTTLFLKNLPVLSAHYAQVAHNFSCTPDKDTGQPQFFVKKPEIFENVKSEHVATNFTAFYKVKLIYFKCWHPNVCKKKNLS